MKLKLICLALACLLFARESYSQLRPDSRYRPIVGTQKRSMPWPSGFIAKPIGGSNVTWDYDSLQVTPFPGEVITVQANGITQFDTLVSRFNTAALADLDTTDFFTYQYSDTTGIYLAGRYVKSPSYAGTNTYYRPRIQLKYGMEVGEKYADSSRNLFTNITGSYPGTFLDTVEYMGYGTLKMPGGTVHNDAILIRASSYRITDSTLVQIEPHSYLWFLPNGFGSYSFGIFSEWQPDGLFDWYEMYADVAVSAKPNASALALTVLPNPSSNTIRISGLADVGPVQVRVISAQGRNCIVLRKFPENGQVDVSKLPKGLYRIEACVAGTRYSAGFAKE